MIEKAHLKADIDSNLWEDLKIKFPDLEENELVDKIINEYGS